MRNLNILVSPYGRDGCSGYRLANPYKAINKIDMNRGVKQEDWIQKEVIFLKPTTPGEDILKLVSSADVIVFRDSHYPLFKLIKDKEISKALMVIDFDDDIYNMTPFTDNYATNGLKEVEWEGKMLWQDGKDGFDIKANKKRKESIEYMIKEADLVTVTTDYLAGKLKEMGAKKVEVLDNAIDFEHWKKWELKKDKEIRIGWTGGSTHYIDWHSIKDSLKRVFDKYDNLKLVLQGCKWDGTIKDIPHEFHEWIDFEGHPYKTASLNLDIAIIPLKDTEFNRSKSCIKWYEFSSLVIPSVVSNVLPYSKEISEETAMPYNTPEEFESQLCKLIEDEKLRKKIGNNAYKWVKENKDLKEIAKQYINIFKDERGKNNKTSSIIH